MNGTLLQYAQHNCLNTTLHQGFYNNVDYCKNLVILITGLLDWFVIWAKLSMVD